MDLFLNLWSILKNSLIYIFVRYLSYSLLKIQRKLTSGYLLCDKATITRLFCDFFLFFICISIFFLPCTENFVRACFWRWTKGDPGHSQKYVVICFLYSWKKIKVPFSWSISYAHHPANFRDVLQFPFPTTYQWMIRQVFLQNDTRASKRKRQRRIECKRNH
jgi:hypothetical protein